MVVVMMMMMMVVVVMMMMMMVVVMMMMVVMMVMMHSLPNTQGEEPALLYEEHCWSLVFSSSLMHTMNVCKSVVLVNQEGKKHVAHLHLAADHQPSPSRARFDFIIEDPAAAFPEGLPFNLLVHRGPGGSFP
eukprot:scaffold7433_cov19-Tisochrysis_lutea.AAC.1